MKLRPYHNPQNADESIVPDGWRMLYAEEFPLPLDHNIPCRLFVRPVYGHLSEMFSIRQDCSGQVARVTYIIPVIYGLVTLRNVT